MKPTEVRIGNIFVDDKSKSPLRVVGINENSITFDTIPVGGALLEGWQAISMLVSIDALKKLGCKQSENDHFIWRTPEGKMFTYRKTDGTVVVQIFGRMVEIKTVHDLQNAVHIAGEELTLK